MTDEKSLDFVLPSSITVPFTSLDFWQGAEASGLLTANAAGLTLEFQIAQYDDSLWPTVIERSDVQNAMIPLSEIKSLELKGWLETKIGIETKTLAPLSKIPGHRQGIVWLAISDKHRVQAKELISIMHVRISQYALTQVQGDR